MKGACIDRRGLLLAGAGLLLAPVVRAAEPGGKLLSSALRFAGPAGFRLRQRQGAGGRARVALEAVDGGLRASGKPHQLYAGQPVRAALALRPEAALVAWVRALPSAAVQLTVVPRAADGQLGGPVLRLDATAASQRQRGRPVTVIACPDPQGFTVIWQQQWAQPGGRPEAVSMIARVGRLGRWVSRPKRIEVPWALGAVAHNGHGYHLALYFDGARPDQTRLCCVTLDAGGRPQQHPWWISQPQLVDEVQLASVGGGVVAYYRGGARGTALRSVRVTSVGQWGGTPPPSSEHGKISGRQDFALRAGSDGRIEVVRG